MSGAPSLSTAATAASGVGAYSITVGVGTLAAANYDFPNLVNGTLTINKAHLTVTANAATSTYGASPPPLTATLSGFVNGDTSSVVSGVPSLSTAATAASGAGTYAIHVVAGTLAAANYDFPNLLDGTLTINKAHLTVTANTATSAYGASPPPLTAMLSGFVNGDTSSVVSGAPSLSRPLPATAASRRGQPIRITVAAGTLARGELRLPQPAGWHPLNHQQSCTSP